MSECLYLAHHGVQGQKWGVRRYQREDGSLTAAGRRHRGLSLIPKKQDPIKQMKKQAKLERAKAKEQSKLEIERAKQQAKIAAIKAKQDAEIKRIRDKADAEAAAEEAKRQEKEKAKGPPDGKKGFKKLDKMSDEELAAAIKRLQNEKTFKELMGMPIDEYKEDPKTEAKNYRKANELKRRRELENKARDAVRDALLTAGKDKLTDLTKYGITTGINNLLGTRAITKDVGDKQAYLAYEFWKKHEFDSKYAPTSSDNPFWDPNKKDSAKKKEDDK